MTSLVILSEAPYGTDRVYNGLRLAAALQAKGPVWVFVMCDAVVSAVDGQSSLDADANLGGRMRTLIEAGGQVRVCGLCLETRGLHRAGLVPGASASSMPELAEWIASADRVITL